MLGPECTNPRVYTHASATILASLVTAPSREQARAIPVRNRLQCLPNKSSEPSYSIWAVQRLRTSLCTDPARRTASHQLESSLAVTPPISNLKTALITGCGVPQFAISRFRFEPLYRPLRPLEAFYCFTPSPEAMQSLSKLHMADTWTTEHERRTALCLDQEQQLT